MDQQTTINKNRSLGNLQPARKSKPKSPDCVGKVTLKRDLVLFLAKQLGDAAEVVANIAGWKGAGVYGPYMTVDISPRFQKRLDADYSNPFEGLG